MSLKSVKKQSVGKSALQMAFGTMASRVLGLVRELCLAALFPRTVTDAWNVAFRLPNLFRRLLGEGSLSVSFVPVFIDEMNSSNTTPPGKRFVDATFTLLLGATLGLTALGIVFMDPVIRFLTSGEGYQLVEGKVELTIALGRIMFAYLFLVTAYAFFMAILNALGEFAIPAMAPTFFNVVFVTSTLIPDEYGSLPGGFLAWGVIVGGLVQMGILIPALYKRGYLPRITFQWRHPALRPFFKNLGPGLIGMGILQLNVLINTQFASRLEEGTQSWIAWADRILELPLSLIAVSLGSALLPTLARSHTEGRRDEMNDTAHTYWKLLYFLSIPCSAGLFMLSEPIIDVLFRRGHFGARDLEQTSLILQTYAPLLLSTAGIRVLGPSFYAVKNTWLPAATGGVALVTHFFLAQYLMSLYGVAGLSSSLAVSGAFNLLMLLIAYQFMIAPIHWLSLLMSLLRSAMATAPLIGATYLYLPIRDFLEPLIPFIFITKILSLGVTIAVAGVAFIVVALLIKSPEANFIWKRLRRNRS